LLLCSSRLVCVAGGFVVGYPAATGEWVGTPQGNVWCRVGPLLSLYKVALAAQNDHLFGAARPIQFT
jgi:hypothetical protein